MADRLAVLHHHSKSFFPLDLREAVGDGAHLIWVYLDGSGRADPQTRRLLGRRDRVVDLTTDDLDGAARVLAAEGVDGIVTFVDNHLVVAAELAARLDLPYHTPDVARTLANKCLQRQALHRSGVPGPRFWTLPAGLTTADVAEIAADLSYPAVLKPAHGSGSLGVLLVTGPQELLAAYRSDMGQIVEEHLADDPRHDRRFASYLSVETVICDGISHHVAITGRFPLAHPFRETGNFVPAGVDSATQAALLELTDTAIAALGIRTAVIHTEIKLTPDGPRLIEVNGRLGGRPPFVLRQVSDLNLFRSACDVALGRGFSGGMAPCDGVGYWRMLQPPCSAKRIRDVAGLDALGQAPFVQSVRLSRSPGDPVDWRDGTAGHVVTVRGRVADLDSLAEAIAAIDRTVTIAYD